MTRRLRTVCLWTLLCSVGCDATRQVHATTDSALELSRVVLYRNGVAYFERVGVVDGDHLTLKVRKDQINDLLKSLTVVDQGSGKTVSVSIPLDPRAWQNAALSMLLPGRGRLAEVLDALRGTEVEVSTTSRTAAGRIVMVEHVGAVDERSADGGGDTLTLLDDDTLEVIPLAEVTALRLYDGDLIMQLARHLDATAGEGMFQQVEVGVRFADRGPHRLAISYVAEAPMWKPSYRLVLADDGSGKALLQAWAVVSNLSGENWDDVKLSLTSGAPLAFRYDLHTPEQVGRPDLSRSAADKHASVAIGESSLAAPSAIEAAPPAPPMASAPAEAEADLADLADEDGVDQAREERAVQRDNARKRSAGRALAKPAPPVVDLSALLAQQPTAATAKQVAGLTRFDIRDSVRLPDGSASMVQLVNQLVPGEQTFLYRPGGSGIGYEYNPYRVVRFENATEFALEPGPISIYAGGSFVGEGLSEAIASHDRATIPFAADPAITVRSFSDGSDAALSLTRIVRGVLEVQSFRRIRTTWTVEAKPEPNTRRVLVRQPRAADGYNLIDPPPDTELLPDAYFVPIVLAPRASSAKLEVIEQTPTKLALEIWDDKAPELLQKLLAAQDITPELRSALGPIVELRQALARLDSELTGYRDQQAQLDRRAEEERHNLFAIQKDPNAGTLRKRLTERLVQLSQQAADMGRRIVERSRERMEKKIALEDMLRDIDLSLPGQSAQ